MAGDTQITVVGNLTADPEVVAVTGSGVFRARFTVASTSRRFDKTAGSWRDGDPLFLACTAWRELAEHIGESLSRGNRVLVTGRLQMHRWQTEDGQPRSAYGLDVEEIGPSLRFVTATVGKSNRFPAVLAVEPPEPPLRQVLALVEEAGEMAEVRPAAGLTSLTAWREEAADGF
jgi:single-strand DNA-binding protein